MYAAIAAYIVNTFASPVSSNFSHVLFVCKPSDYSI